MTDATPPNPSGSQDDNPAHDAGSVDSEARALAWGRQVRRRFERHILWPVCVVMAMVVIWRLFGDRKFGALLAALAILGAVLMWCLGLAIERVQRNRVRQGWVPRD